MNTNQNRQPKGIPIGGQYATAQRGTAGVSLSTAPTAVRDSEIEKYFGDAERHQALLDGGYVPSTVVPAVLDPRTTRHRPLWQAQAFAVASHGGGDDAIPAMPDDWTPSKRAGKPLGGRSAEGNLSTYRRAWTDDGLTFRMFSRKAIYSFSRKAGGTFSIPVSAIDTETGRSLATEVHVTNLGRGRWSVDCASLSGATKAMVCEAVTARLERRAPALTPNLVGDAIDKYRDSSGNVRDLLRRAAAREAASGAPLEKPETKSQWISAFGYNDSTGVMFTETSNGNTYGHHVSPDIYEAVRGASSPGGAFNALVKGSPRTEVSRCATCSNVYAVSNGHACTKVTKAPAPGPRPSNDVARAQATRIAGAVLPRVARRRANI